MKNTDISIYVPVYNGEKTIEKCLNSILNQTLRPDNILVVNDFSNDRTSEILKKYGEKIVVHDNSKNYGLSFSRNFAINRLNSRYIASIDADVELDPKWLEILYEDMRKNQITFIGGRMFEKYIDNPCNLWRSIRIGQQWGDKSLSNPNFVFGCNNLLDTKNLNKKKIYNLDGEYFKTNGEDIEFSISLKKKNFKLYYSSLATCQHLQDDNYRSLSNRYWRYIRYGDGLKNRNLIKTLKNSFRQLKKTIKWIAQDAYKLRFNLIIINIFVFIYFIKNDFKIYLKSNDGNT